MRKFYLEWSLIWVIGLVFQGAYAADLNPTQILNLIEEYAPLVKFHHNEDYFPSSVEWYLQRSALMKEKDSIYFSDELISEKVSSEFLSQFGDSSFYLTPLGNRRQKNETYKGEPLVEGVSPAPCYANFTETPDEWIIQYLFFYPYNGRRLRIFNAIEFFTGIPLDIHEGDWEHIGVKLSKTALKKYSDITRVFYAHHQRRQGEFFLPETLEYYGTHPIVYSAYHGHASYPHSFRGINRLLDTTSSTGPQWRCWENLVFLGEPDHPTPGNSWIQFGGKWGYGGAPSTPTFQSWWAVD